ncbi:penicillin-binding transpeptidase domain-containing protein [Lipingzhangella sp. LS1_29]|uniref:Penicillin-binding transpeptidase domain-containing protein n=1 Tax=Lipingzhangella rawalii TaxID=2055835 RepID=A0ABU2HBQ4_9ACTN|nr:penicillin-binding transpeptidase domain-containing protein [Lipingzhangella rawalii]MDS1272225.1 penicillin-binding transpeptidase domain-containing protein [Lipingzhangella rawalii]
MRSVRLCRLVPAGMAVGLVLVGCAAQPSPEVAVRGFLLDWQDGDYIAAAERTNGDPEEVAAALGAAQDQLDLAALRLGLAPIHQDGDSAHAEFEAQADLGIGDPVWSYLGGMDLEQENGDWVVDWDPSVIHPELQPEERLAVTYNVPARGQILDRDREPLVEETDIVEFGVRPADMPDLDGGVAELAELLDDSAARILDRVRSAPPEEFQPLVLHRAEDIGATLIADAESIDGVETRETAMPLRPVAAPGLVGEVAGTREHNIADRVSGPYQAGDTIGISGLQSGYQQELAGTATTRIVALDGQDHESRVLQEWPGDTSSSLVTSLDRTVQDAAQGALATEPLTSHLVVVDRSSGELRAVASQPSNTDNTGALTDTYRPGAAFTIVTAAALLDAGVVTPEDVVACPDEVTVGDVSITNPDGVSAGDRTLTQQFAQGCVTAFAELAESLDGQQLTRAASALGIGAEVPFPVDMNPGTVAEPAGAAEVVATAVGAAEGTATVSALSMAQVAATVAEGEYSAPVLVPDDDGQADGDTETDAGDASAEPDAELSGAVAGQLRDMMGEAVSTGETPALRGVGAEPVHGQHGEVRQTIDEEERVVQWFVGYRDDLAFAAVTELPSEFVAGNSHQYAVGFTADFLQRLPQEPAPL